MESYLTRPETIKFRIRRNQRKAMSAGIFYWVGILLLLCFSVFPYVSNLRGFNYEDVQNGELWIVTFIKPIEALLSAGTMTSEVLLAAVLSILYLLYIVISVIAAIVATSRLFRITKRNPTNKWGYNRAARAMKVIGKCFSLMFFMMVAMVILGVVLLDGRPTLFFYLAFIIGALFHFFGNVRSCKVSFFEITEDRFNPIEITRTLTVKISLLRNTLQIVCIGLVLLLIDRLIMNGVAPYSFFKILDGVQQSLFDELLIPLFLVIVAVALIVAAAHTTGSAEYSADGEKAKGMKTCRNAALVIAVFGLLGAVLAVVSGTIDKSATIILLGIFFIGVQWIFAEKMFASFAMKQEAAIAQDAETENAPAEEKPKKEKKEKVKKEKTKKEKKEKVKKEKANKKAKATEEAVETPLPEVSEEVVSAPETVEETVETIIPEIVEETADESKEEKAEPAPKYVHRDPTYFVPDFLSTPNFDEEKPEQVSASSKPYANGKSGFPFYGADMDNAPAFATAAEAQQEAKENAAEKQFVKQEAAKHSAQDPTLEELRKKWLAEHGEVAKHAPVLNTRLLDAQQVHCPCCNTLLHVRFGWTQARCSKCGTTFELRKRTHHKYF